MPDAFSPIGLMLDEWGNAIAPGTIHGFRIIAINDLESEWRGAVRLQILNGKGVVSENAVGATVPPYGSISVLIPCTVPLTAGTYTVEAILEKNGEKPVRSIREIPVR